MNIESLLLIAKVHSEQYPLMFRMYEMQCHLFCQNLGWNKEQTQQFVEHSMNLCQTSSDQMLVGLLENLKTEFPAAFENQPPIQELIKKISPSFPGKSQSPYNQDLN